MGGNGWRMARAVLPAGIDWNQIKLTGFLQGDSLLVSGELTIILKKLCEISLMSANPQHESSPLNQPTRWQGGLIEGLNLSDEKLNELMKVSQLMEGFLSMIDRAEGHKHKNIIFEYCGKYESLGHSGSSICRLLDKRIERMIKNRKIKRNWSEDDLQILVWVVVHYAGLNQIPTVEQFTPEDWNLVSRLIPGTTGEGCMFRVLSLRKTKLSDQKWLSEQSAILSKLVGNNKNVDWKAIAHDLFKQNSSSDKIFRNPKQCKEHWTCYLDPSLRKGPWDLEEDIKLLEYVSQNDGKKKWAQMAKVFKGRTENALKNRYSLILEKHQNTFVSKNELEQVRMALRSLRSSKPENSKDIRKKAEKEESQIFEESPEDKNKEGAEPNKEDRMVQNEMSMGFALNSQRVFPMMFSGTPHFFLMLGGNQF